MKYSPKQWLFVLLTQVIFCACTTEPLPAVKAEPPAKYIQGKELFETQDASFVLDTIITGIQKPYGFEWLPNGQVLLSERGKKQNSLGLLNIETGKITYLCHTPDVFHLAGNGMMDIVLHPDYKNNGWIYFSYCLIRRDSTSTLVIDRARLRDSCLYDNERIFEMMPYFKSDNHFGTRMKFSNGFLFVSMGERYDARDSAQVLTNDFGKIIRLNDDGSIPANNPFAKVKNARHEIWTYGHRNIQGMAIHPATGELWIDEHGPRGGDEINIIHPGLNYGWPVICYGINYDSTIVGRGITHKAGMEQPLYYYRPSIAPSGMEFYTGDKFTKWEGNIFIGALALTHLNRLVVEGNRIIHEERLLEKNKWRVRFAKQGPDGYLYIGVDAGMIVRLRPVGE